MKTLWRSIVVCTGVLLAITIPVRSETASKIANPLPPTDAPLNENAIAIERSSEYQSGYQQGRREAEENIGIGKPTIYTIGLWQPDSSAIDPKTGFMRRCFKSLNCLTPGL